MKKNILLIIVSLFISTSKNQAQSTFPYKNKSLSAEMRTTDLLSRMTLVEKIAQMECINYGLKDTLFAKDGSIRVNVIKNKYYNGLGQIAEFCKSNNWLETAKQVEAYNTIQKAFIEKTRLGIPVIFHDEGLHGVTAMGATSFPQPIALAGTFNPELAEKIYSLTAHEARSRGVQQLLSPVLDVARDPRWGRCEETFGEDPFLIGEMGVSVIKGLQGDNTFDNAHVVATLKHFAAHGQPENGTNCAPANVSERVLRDVLLYPFEQVVKRTQIASIMPSYNEIDGVPSHANKWLLKTVLRNEWGFKGYLVSDYFAISQLNLGADNIGHHVAKDWTDAAYLAVNAGVNIELPIPEAYAHLSELVKSGRIKESTIDSLVYPLLLYKFKLGLFDNPYLDVQNALKINGNDDGRKLALDAAHQSIVMLKNKNNIAPLDLMKAHKIAIIGPNANRVLLGEYYGRPKQFITVLDGFKNRIGSKSEILYSEGCKITTTEGWSNDNVELAKYVDNIKSISEAMKTARQSDVIILAVGGNEQTSREGWNLHHIGDRANLDLIGEQNLLIDSLATLGKPIIAIVINGSPIAFANLKLKADAIFECWYLGQECGNAIADVVLGNYNPSAKLSMSIPRSAAQLPSFYNYKPLSRRGYLFDSISPLYPFGYGMSYSQFKFGKPEISKATISKTENTSVYVDVTNTSKYAGTEIVQLYIRDEVSSVTRPIKELKAFKRVTLQPGETQRVELEITPQSLSFHDINMNYTVEPGDFTLMVGSSSRTEDLQNITLTVKDM